MPSDSSFRRQIRIGAILALSIVLQSSLPQIWAPLVYIDLPLVVVVFFALQRDLMQAVIIGMIAGVAEDLCSGGLLGAGGFSKTLTAYMVASLAIRVRLDNPVLRIPVLAGATVLDSVIFVVLHRVLGQPSIAPFVELMSVKLIATTVAGTVVWYLLEAVFSERARQRRQFAFRRRTARRHPVVRLGRRS